MPDFRLDPSRFWEQLSIPSAVFAEASWYGSIRAGWTSASGPKDTTDADYAAAGVSQFGSRWGIKGASEVSDGLSAVYKFETRIYEGSNQATDQLYVGLAGGFGTVSMGKLPAAGNVHAGFVDQALWLGSNEKMLTGKQGSVISYASPSIGGFSFQVDAQGDSGGAQDKDVDSAQFGATLQLGENGKIGMAYVDRATTGADTPTRKANAKVTVDAGEDAKTGEVTKAAVAADDLAHIDDDKTAMIVGHYTLGGVSAYLGYGQRKWDTDSKAAKWENKNATGAAAYGYGKGLDADDLLSKKKKTTFFGFHGGIGDTGVNFLVQVRSNKTDSNKVAGSYDDRLKKWAAGKYASVTAAAAAARTLDLDLNDAGTEIRESGQDDSTFETIAVADASPSNLVSPANIDPLAVDGSTPPTPEQTADAERKTAKSSEKNTPFVIGVSRSLGGGATIHLEHANTDNEASHNQTALILQVDF